MREEEARFNLMGDSDYRRYVVAVKRVVQKFTKTEGSKVRGDKS